MKRHATFWSAAFKNKTPEPHFINERCFGEDLIQWLRERLASTSFEVGEAIQEDYGWGFGCEVAGEPYWTHVGVMDDSIGLDRAEWLLGVTYDPGFNVLRRLFSKPREANLFALCRAVDEALRSDTRVEEVLWWHEPHVGTATKHPA